MKKKHSAPRGKPRGSVRIIGGKWRGRKLEVADVPGLRPTGDRVRETLFNWLAPHIEGARCLDLFAGTGALGFEALSRGAASCTFVEKSTVAVRMLERSSIALNASDAEVVHHSAQTFLENNTQTYDLVFLDPPFADDVYQTVLEALAKRNLLSPHGWVYVESDGTQDSTFGGMIDVLKHKRIADVDCVAGPLNTIKISVTT